MSRSQRIVFIVGLLALIALLASLTGIVLYRAFPESRWVTLIGPLGAAAAVLTMRKMLSG